MDWYKELELEEGAGPDEVKKAYRRLAKKYHPDLHGNTTEANEKINRIQEAYEGLMSLLSEAPEAENKTSASETAAPRKRRVRTPRNFHARYSGEK